MNIPWLFGRVFFVVDRFASPVFGRLMERGEALWYGCLSFLAWVGTMMGAVDVWDGVIVLW